jgi:aspartate kinase
MRVLKFGGTSVQDAARVRAVTEILRRRTGERTVVVFSAMGRTTDRLFALGRAASEGHLDESLAGARALGEFHLGLARELLPAGEARWRMETLCEQFSATIGELARSLAVLGDFSPAARDRLLGTGELLGSNILCECFRERSLPARWVDARTLVVTDANHACAEPFFEKTSARCRATLLPLLEGGLMPVTQGFIARSEAGSATTLGRGGSDYTATLIGAALGADEVEVWTDVDGILTADPTLVPEARNIPLLSFREASELAFFGARVLHPKTLQPAVDRAIPVRVLNTCKPDGPGTLVLSSVPPSDTPVKSIAYKEAVSLVSLVSARMFKAHGFLRCVFEALDRFSAAPDALATSEVSVSMAFHGFDRVDELARALGEFGSVEVREGLALVCVAGEGLREDPGVVAAVFSQLEDVRIEMAAQGGSEVALAFVVDEADLPRVVRRLHARFFEGERSATATAPEALPQGPTTLF